MELNQKGAMMAEIETVLARVELGMRNWIAWQNTATTYRMSLDQGGAVRTFYVDEGEGRLFERILLRLKKLNSKLYLAVVIWYQHIDTHTVTQIAKMLGCCRPTLYSRHERAEAFISGFLN